MSALLQTILSSISGAVIGAFCFGLWFMVLMSVYISLYGYFSVNLLIFSSVTLDKPILTALIIGLMVGSILGLFTGLTVSLLGANNIFKCMVIGIIITAVFLSSLIFLSSGVSLQNPLEFIFVIIADIPIGLLKSFWLFIPSAATGVILARVISFITSK